jgi:uncharacterized protein YkwD
MRRLALVLVLLMAGCGGGTASDSTGGGLTTTAPSHAQGETGDATQADEAAPDDDVTATHATLVPVPKNGERPLPHCTDDGLPVNEQTKARAEAAALCVVNKIRQGRGRGGLKKNSSLYAAAEAHASEMVKGQFFSHTSPSGRTMSSRVRSTGYTHGATSWRLGENIAWGSSTYSTAAAIVQGWMNSPGHRANIMRRAYKECGMAIAVGAPVSVEGDAGTYVNDFGKK